MKRFTPWLLCALLFIASCKKKSDDVITPPPPPPTVTPPGDNDPLLLGNPTNAVTSTSQPENYLKDNTYYKLAYSRSRGTAVWVGWHLESGDLGSTPRQDDFRGDAGLPAGWYQVQTSDYSTSGFDRGHNCPSGDRTLSVPQNSSTFLMTNMIPQAPNLNQGPWEALEDFVRTSLVGTTKEAYIYMGNTGIGGVGSAGPLSDMAGGKIFVPAKVWKVVIIMDKGNGDLARLHSDATVLAVNMPNDNTLYSTSGTGRNAWRNYLTTINALESDARSASVPLNLLSGVADSIKTILKNKLYF